MRILCLCLLALAGCKNTDSLPGPTVYDLAFVPDLMPPPDLMPLPGVVNGTFGGIAFQPTAAVAATAMVGAGGSLGLVYLLNKSTACQMFSMSPPIQPKSLTGMVFFLSIIDGGGNQTPPTVTGMYPINSGGGTVTGPVSSVKFIQTDATCMTVTASGQDAASGAVNLTNVANGNYAGTFDLMMQHGGAGPMDHVTGEFHSMDCPGLAAIFNVNPACEP